MNTLAEEQNSDQERRHAWSEYDPIRLAHSAIAVPKWLYVRRMEPTNWPQCWGPSRRPPRFRCRMVGVAGTPH